MYFGETPPKMFEAPAAGLPNEVDLEREIAAAAGQRHRPNRRCPRDLHAGPPAGSSGPPLVPSLTARASDQEEP